mgnify:CR=1 FL=1
MFNANTLSRMRATQQGKMQDLCRRMLWSPTTDAHRQVVPGHTEITVDIPCGLEMKPGSENQRDRVTELRWDAVLRVPISTTWDERDLVKVIARYGEALSEALTFSIVGPVQRGPSGCRLRLAKVLPNDPQN